MTPTPFSMRERLRTDYAWTARQKQVLELIERGRSNTEIAEELGLSLAGAKWHVSEILSKLQADQREEAAEYWRRYNGLAPRFERIFRGIATGGSALKWAGGSAAVLAAGAAAVAIVAIAINQSSDEPAASSQPTAVPTADAGVQTGATPTVSGDTVNGVPVQKLAIGSPGRGGSVFPRDVALFYTQTCYACDGGFGDLRRSYIDASGTVRTEDLFASLRAASGGDVVNWKAESSMATIAATVCTRGYCGGVAEPSDDAEQSLWHSSDGGVSWAKLRDVAAYSWVGGFVDGDVVLTTFDPNTEPKRRVWLASSGASLAAPVPDGALYGEVKPGLGMLWSANRSQYLRTDGTPLFPSNPVGGEYNVYGRWAPGRTYISWLPQQPRPGDPEPAEYIGVVDDAGRLLAVYEWPVPYLRIVGEVNATTIVVSGRLKAEPQPGDRMFAYETAIVSLFGKVGGMPILELSRGMTGNQNPFAQGLAIGPFARVNAGGDCLNVRESASTSAASLACYVDGVLLRDLGESREAGGATWLKVATPDGREGWASAEFLER